METPQPPPQSPTPPAVAGKRPMPTGAKVGIGCGILVVIGLIVMLLLVNMCKKTVGDYMKDFSENPERATAELIVKMNPELDLVETNDEDGTITFRDKSGKETTVTYADLADGKLTVSDSEGGELTFGAADMETVPAWVPRLPETTRIASSHHAVDDGKVSGSYMANTPMETAAIEAFLVEQAAALDMESSMDSRHSADGQEMRMLGFKGAGRGFSATIIRGDDGEAHVQFIYEDESGR